MLTYISLRVFQEDNFTIGGFSYLLYNIKDKTVSTLGGTLVLWLPLLPHSKKAPGLDSIWGLTVEFPRACEGFFEVFWLPPKDIHLII